MNKLFKLKISLTAETSSQPPLENVEPSVVPALQSFVDTFHNDPDAIKEYYAGQLIESYFSDHDEVETLKTKIGYRQDHRELFMKVASRCKPDSKQLVEAICLSGEEGKGVFNQELIWDQLLNLLGTLRIEAASFNIVSDAPAN